MRAKRISQGMRYYARWLTIPLSFLIVLSTQAQSEHLPLYSLVFSSRVNSADDQTIITNYVATAYDDDTWEVHPILSETEILQIIGNSGVRPYWASDERTLYLTLWDSPEKELARSIVTYDIFTRQFGSPIQVFETATSSIEGVRVISVSPDQHYAIASLVLDYFTDYLINLQTGAVFPLWDELECPISPLLWLEDQILLSRWIGYERDCTAGVIFTLDLATGKAVQTFSNPYAGEGYPQILDSVSAAGSAIQLTDGRVLLGGDGDGIGLLNLADGTVVFTDASGWNLSLSEDQQTAAFAIVSGPQQVGMVDLQEIPSYTMFKAHLSSDYWWDGNTLHFWDIPGVYLHYDTIQNGQLSKQTLYKALGLSGKATSTHWVAFDEGKGDNYSLNILYEDGSLWEVDTSPYTDKMAQTSLAASGDWLYVLIGNDWNSQQHLFSVNVETHQYFTPPISPAHLLSISPDGRWWIYAYLDDTTPQPDTLIAYNVETGQTITLQETLGLGHRDSISRASFDFTWSK